MWIFWQWEAFNQNVLFQKFDHGTPIQSSIVSKLPEKFSWLSLKLSKRRLEMRQARLRQRKIWPNIINWNMKKWKRNLQLNLQWNKFYLVLYIDQFRIIFIYSYLHVKIEVTKIPLFSFGITSNIQNTRKTHKKSQNIKEWAYSRSRYLKGRY